MPPPAGGNRHPDELHPGHHQQHPDEHRHPDPSAAPGKMITTTTTNNRHPDTIDTPDTISNTPGHHQQHPDKIAAY